MEVVSQTPSDLDIDTVQDPWQLANVTNTTFNDTSGNNASHELFVGETFGQNPSYFKGFALVFTVMVLVAIVVILVGNGLVLEGFRRFHSLRVPAHYLVVSLSVADLLTGINLCITFLQLIPSLDNWRICIATSVIVNTSHQASLYSIIMINVDRYVAVNWPLRYPSIITKQRVKLVLGGAWLLSILSQVTSVSLPAYVPAPLRDDCNLIVIQATPVVALFDFGIIVVGLLVVGITNSLNGRAAWRALALAPPQLHGPATELRERYDIVRRELKILWTVTIVTGIFAVCRLPFTILNLMAALGGLPALHIRAVFSFVSLLNSALNPIVYAYRIKPFRLAFKRIACWHGNVVEPSFIFHQS